MNDTISLREISPYRKKGLQLDSCDKAWFHEIMKYCVEYYTVLQRASELDAHKKSLAVQLAASTVLDFISLLKYFSNRIFAVGAEGYVNYVLKAAHGMSTLHVIDLETVRQLCTDLYMAMSAEYEENGSNYMVNMEGTARLKQELVQATETLLVTVEDSADPQARAAASTACAAASTACAAASMARAAELTAFVAQLVVKTYDVKQILNGLAGIRNWPISTMPVTPLDPVLDALTSFRQLLPEQRSGALPGIMQQFNQAIQDILKKYYVNRRGYPDRYCYYDPGDGTVMKHECHVGFLKYLGHYCGFFHRGLTAYLQEHLKDPIGAATATTAAAATAATATTATAATAAAATAATAAAAAASATAAAATAAAATATP